MFKQSKRVKQENNILVIVNSLKSARKSLKTMLCMELQQKWFYLSPSRRDFLYFQGRSDPLKIAKKHTQKTFLFPYFY